MIRVVRQASGAVARFRGTATWAPDAAGMLCEEAGSLRTGGVVVAASRVTLWRADGDGIAVAFADGRPFHRVGPAARHDCPPDGYRLAYDFACWPGWSVTWRVTGPRKAYLARTRYARA